MQVRSGAEIGASPDPGDVVHERATIKAVLSGDSNAFQNLVETHQTRVYGLALRMLGNEREAEDAAQDAFTQAYTRLGSYNPEWRFKTWVMTITSNLCIDRLRRRKIEPMAFADYAPNSNISGEDAVERDFASDAPGPDAVAIQRQRTQAVQALLNDLPAEDRGMVVMFYWHDQSYEEIAKALNTSVSAVKSRLFRARQKMAQSRQAESLNV
jgi:RNA polymerase sigma-70 factor, ECF subfamily